MRDYFFFFSFPRGSNSEERENMIEIRLIISAREHVNDGEEAKLCQNRYVAEETLAASELKIIFSPLPFS